MQTNEKPLSKAQRVTLLGLMTALVVVLQLLGSFIHFGMFSVSLVLIPIVIGAALLGPLAGGWLGLVFGVTVLVSGDAAFFMGFSIVGTVVTVLVKGIAAGVAAGVVYSLLQKWNRWVAILVSALVCPVVNTGVFVAGCYLFFLNDLSAVAADQAQWLITATHASLGADGNFEVTAAAANYEAVRKILTDSGCAILTEELREQNVTQYIFYVLVGGNFLFEVLFNLILSPTILRLTKVGEKIFGRSRTSAA